MSERKYKPKYIFIAVLLVFSACSKENQQIDYNVGVLASQEYVQSQQMMNLMINTYFKSISDSLLIVDHHSEIDGAIVTYSEEPVEKIVIDYPGWGSNDDFGHYRAGTIIATPNPGFYDSLAVISFSFDNFLFDHDTVYIYEMRITNLGRIDGSHFAFKIMVGAAQRIYADTNGMTQFDVNQNFIMYKDPSSIFHSPEDYFEITGTINGISSTDNKYTASLFDQEYIMDQYSCRWAKLGPATLSFESVSYDAFVLFPGADTCLNKYAVGIDGNPFFYPFD